jgi:NADPH:quinone reductase-like Zn-dependent oxidoreductase
MRAIVYDPGAKHGLRLDDVADPSPAPSEALVRVTAVSLNWGELAHMAEQRAPGEVPGWDAAGIVIAAAEDGSGPPAGAEVVTFGWLGAWAALRAVDTRELAVVPEGLPLADAAALPVAGVTALRAVRALGPVLGRRVLVTGASGGVGRFAVQLAALAGAHVVAAVGRPERAEGLDALGAAEVVVGAEGGLGTLTEPVSAAIDNVGGALLADVYRLAEPGGIVLSVGMASGQPTTIDFEHARIHNGNARIQAFNVGSRLGSDLAHLAALTAAGRLDPQVGWRGPWEDVADAADALLGRRVLGKAVLEVGS